MDLTQALALVAIVLGSSLILGMIIAAIMVFIGLLLSLLFYKTRKIVVPGITLPILTLLESPIRFILWKFKVGEDIVSNMMIDLRNIRYKDQYKKVPYEERMIFIPQCLRNPKCPAPLTDEGIKCLNCGRCGLGLLKEEAEQMGTKFFIAPGSSLIKRMIKKYKPKAILGVGCSMEVKEGTAVIADIGLPVQGVKLHRDGCVNTRVDVVKIMEMIRNPPTGKYDITEHPEDFRRAQEIASKWFDDGGVHETQVKVRK